MLSNLEDIRRYRHVVKLKRYENIDMLSNLKDMRRYRHVVKLKRYRHVVKRYQKI